MRSLAWHGRQGLALGWLALGREAAALAVFDAMLERWPDDPHALASHVHLAAQMRRLGPALTGSRRLTALRPEDAPTWFNHGYLLEASGQWEEALAAFCRATAINPAFDRAWYGQGLVLIRLQRWEEAVAALERNVALQPMSPCGWYQLARVHVDRNEPDAARKIIRRLQQFEPRVAEQLVRETGLRTP